MNTAFFTSRKGCLGRKVSNPSLESKKIGSILRADFDSRYKSIGKNTYVVSEKDYYPFCALKCFEFHVEVFASGNYFIHFYPATKFISSVRPIHVKYIHDLKRIAGSNTVGIFSVKDIFHCTLIKTNNLDLLQEDVSVKKDLYLTFTAEFISECSPAISKLIYKEAQKTLEYTVGFLERILVEVENLNQIPGLQRGPVEIEVQNLNRNDNLLVGSGECVEMVVKDKAMTRYGLRLELSLANQCLNQTSIAFIQDADRTRWSDFDSMPLPFSVKARIDSKYNHGNTVRIHEFISRPSEQVHVPTDKKYACYYSGVYRPVNGWSILPVVFGKFNLDAFKDSFLKLNRNVNDFHILEGVHKKVDDINTCSVGNPLV